MPKDPVRPSLSWRLELASPQFWRPGCCIRSWLLAASRGLRAGIWSWPYLARHGPKGDVKRTCGMLVLLKHGGWKRHTSGATRNSWLHTVQPCPGKSSHTFCVLHASTSKPLRRTTRERVRPFLCRRPAVRRKPLNPGAGHGARVLAGGLQW